jgi:hypothetical protein
MSRTAPSKELDLIESIVAAHPRGIGISDIEAEMARRQNAKVNRRTLQRRLQKLIATKRVSAEGRSIALVYKLSSDKVVELTGVAASATLGLADAELYVSVSPEGARIRDQVRVPLMHRRPVGYHREFLEAYQPGQTFYLSASLRSQLHDMGRTSANERPAGTYARDILSRLLVDLSWASSKLEGNTYSRLDTQNLIELGQVA